MKIEGFRFTLGEVAGSVADLGVLVPLVILLIVNNGMNPTAVLAVTGLLYIVSGLVFRVPVAVQPLKAVAAEIEDLGRRAVVQTADVTQEAAVRALVDATRAAFGGRIDILVNAAGITGPVETPVSEINVADFDEVLAVNVRGTFLPIKHVLPTMIAQRYGKIINISGTSGLRGYKYRAAYSSSKCPSSLTA